MDWKLQNNREKRSISRKKRILLVGNLKNLAKNRQVCLSCHINVKRNQETGNSQTDKQSTVTLVRMRRALIMTLGSNMAGVRFLSTVIKPSCSTLIQCVRIKDKTLHQASDYELTVLVRYSARRAHVALRSYIVSHGGMGSLFGARWRQCS